MPYPPRQLFSAFCWGRYVREGVVDGDAARLVGNSGLSAVGEDGQPCAPTHSDPLPLDSVLDLQYRLRLKWIADRKPVSL